MTRDPSPADTQPMPMRHSWNWLLYMVGALVLIGLLTWATQKELARNPARDATTKLGSYSLVTIRFSTDPNPALPTGTVMLSFIPMDSRQRLVALDSLTFEYGREGGDQPIGSGEAQPMSDGSGMLMGGAQFPAVGNWWIRVKLSKGGAQAEVRFTVYVEPAP